MEIGLKTKRASPRRASITSRMFLQIIVVKIEIDEDNMLR
ncbi:uncharacterized protein G2W53_016408 [Senna tora]|uniref:Uncharacterized protein n=1 Tax=Senna tora TaxID=362788 RepID=A0A834WQ56_9FABA|nr:uncharacterized protein G2W53_016408 [Senna tora]